MESFLPTLAELPLTPAEDERWQGAIEPDLQRSLTATAKPLGWAIDHGVQRKQSFSYLNWTLGKT